MADILKFMHCGCEYNFGTPSGIKEEIFGTGEDGDCVLQYCDSDFGNIFMEAKVYNFNNLTICDNVKLRFCGEGVPIIRVKGCFINNGELNLRNPLIKEDSCLYEPNLKQFIKTGCNPLYTEACSLYDSLQIECLQGGAGGDTTCSLFAAKGGIGGNGGAGGCAGLSGCAGCDDGTGNCPRHGAGGNGGTSSYANAGGGGGGGGGDSPNRIYESSDGYACNGGNGCNAPSDGVGGRGGDGGCARGDWSDGNNHHAAVSGGAGGGGGFGYCQGGDGGDGGATKYISRGREYDAGVNGNGGNGGNSIIGKGGDGGAGKIQGNGGCSYAGNGGCGYCGGCSMYGNGGDGTGGGYSLFGTSGNASYSRGIDACGSCSRARGGTYGLGLFATNIENNGYINGRGGNGNGTQYCNNGAQIYMAYTNKIASGDICVIGGNGGGQAGFVREYVIGK